MEQQSRSRLVAPGIVLIVVGSIGLLISGGYCLLSAMLIISDAPGMSPPPEMTDKAERYGFYFGIYGVTIISGLNAFLQIIVVLGGIAMTTVKRRGLAVAGGIISVAPCFGSSVCFVGIPFGIWALIVLSNPNLRRVFK